MAGMNVDCAQCDNRVTYIKSVDFRHTENAKRPVFANFGAYPRLITRGRSALYEPENNPNLPESVPIGEIDQPKMKTFGYWESTLPLMNEAGLSIGESSCGTKLVGAPEYLLDMTELVRIAAERCATSRCAVDTMGALSEEYGFMAMKNEITPGTEKDGKPAFDDAGEALLLADTTGEVWVFHITGGWKGVAKATWAAQKVPKGHVTVLANTFIIGELPVEPNEEFRFNRNIRETAVAANIWSPAEGPLHFAKVFGMDIVTFQRKPDELPIPLYTSLRTWRVFDLLAPSLRLPVHVANTDYPFSVKPDRPISHREVFRILGDYYQDSEFDLREGILAGPFGTPYRLEGGNAKSFAQSPRAISIPRTSYSVLGQSMKNSPETSVAWFAVDQPMTSVYIPLLASVKTDAGVAPSYSKGNLWEFDRESAFWAFDFVSNWMNMNWRNMSSEEVFPLQQRLQNEIDRNLTQAAGDLIAWQRGVQENVVSRWWQLADRCVVKYNDGYYTRVGQDVNGAVVTNPVIGKSYGLPDWFYRMIGQSADVHPVWVQPWDGETEVVNSVVAKDKNSLPARLYDSTYNYQVPTGFDYHNKDWIMGKSANTASTIESESSSLFTTSLTVMVSMATGVAIGLFLSKSFRKEVRDCKKPLLG